MANWRLGYGTKLQDFTGSSIYSITFTSTNTCYFADWGDDRNSGGPNDPLATLDAALLDARAYMVGSGVHYITTSYHITVPIQKFLIGDNLTIVNASTNNSIVINTNRTEPRIHMVRFLGITPVGNYVSHYGNQYYDFSYWQSMLMTTYQEQPIRGNVYATKETFNIARITTSYGANISYNITMYMPNVNAIALDGYFTWSKSIICIGQLHFNFTNSATFRTNYFEYSYIVADTLFQFPGEGTFSASTTIDDLRSRAATAYGGTAADYFPGCYVGPSPWNDPENYDLTLNTNSNSGLIAASLTPDNSYVGAFDVGIQWSFSDFTLSNIDASGNLINTGSIATATGVVKTLGTTRLLGSTMIQGVESHLNGEQFDSTRNLGTTLTSVLNGSVYEFTVSAASTYVVNDDEVIYAGASYLPGQTFTTADPVGTAPYSNGSVATIQEVTERPNRRSVEWRFSRGEGVYSDISTKPSLTNGDVFCVLTGTISDGTSYGPGEFVTYNSGNTYTGTYSIQFVWNDTTKTWLNFATDANQRLSGERTGLETTKGNADTTFAYDTDVEYDVRAKYVQPRVTIQVDNLRS